MFLYIIIGFTILIALTITLVLIKYYRLKELDSITDICEDKIKDTLNKKYEVLNKLKEESKNKDIIKLMNFEENIDIFQKEKILFDVKWNLNKIIEEKKYKPKKESLKILNDLNKIEDDIEGLKDYYNSKAITYNDLYFKKPYNLIFKILKIKKKKTFTLRKIDEYEILKD